MKRFRTGVVCLSGVMLAAGMAMAGPPGTGYPNIKARPVFSQPDGGTPGTQADLPAMPPVPKQPVQFSEWSRTRKPWPTDVAKNLHTVIYEGGPKDPHHFYAYGFDVQRHQNVFFVTGDLKELPKFRSMLPAPSASGEQSATGSEDAGTSSPRENIAQLPGGEPPPPPPGISEEDHPWYAYAYQAWTKSLERVRAASIKAAPLKAAPLKATPTP